MATLSPRRLALRTSSVLLCLLLWHMASTHHVNLKLIDFRNVPTPEEVLSALLTLLGSPKLWLNISSSLLRIAAGFSTAAILGVGIGLLVGRWRWAEDLLLPPLELLRPIPAVAWIPLAVLMFPSLEVSMIFITFTGALFPILLSTVHGVEAIDQRLLASARSLGASRQAIFIDVIIPAAAPSIVTGLAIGMGTCWFCLVTAEMISGQFGIGYYTWESYTLQNYPDIIVGMLVIGLFGMGSSSLIKALGNYFMPWYQPKRKHA